MHEGTILLEGSNTHRDTFARREMLTQKYSCTASILYKDTFAWIKNNIFSRSVIFLCFFTFLLPFLGTFLIFLFFFIFNFY